VPRKFRPIANSGPFQHQIGPHFGEGQDNDVYRLVTEAPKPHLRVPTGWLVKINHVPDTTQDASRHQRDPDERRAVEKGIAYKKNKYDLLKLFLGDFVPNSAFVMGEVQEGSRKRVVEYTIQQEVPKFKISDLSDEQKTDPRLVNNTKTMLNRLAYMYRVLGEANARTTQGVNLDGKLDLGGISDYVRADRIDRDFTETDAHQVIDGNNSPNLLVDPNTMQLYCVDFDQGQWTPGMDEAKELAISIVKDDQAKHIGSAEMLLPTVAA
jgi:hypothetical protein